MDFRKFLVITLAAIMGVGFTGCTQKPAEQQAAENSGTEGQTDTVKAGKEEDKQTTGDDTGETLYIPVISKGFSQQFWQTVKIGADKAGADYGVTVEFVGPESETMIDKQVEMMEAALNKNPDAICLAALDTKALTNLLQTAKERNIPIIGFDSGVDSDIPLTTAATDNYAAAVLLADKMAELIGNEGEVAVIVTDQVGASSIARRDGFCDTIKEKYPNITVVDVLYGESDPLKSTDLSKTTMQAYPNLKGFVGLNEGSAIGVLNAVKELDKNGQIVVLGFDSGKQQIEAVRNGTMAGAITQNPIGMGYIAVESAIKAIRGESLEPIIDTGFFFYTKENIDTDEIKPLLYE